MKRANKVKQAVSRSVPAQNPHGFVVTPQKMLCKFPIQCGNGIKFFMIMEIALITAMAALNLAVVPGRARRDELVGNALQREKPHRYGAEQGKESRGRKKRA